MEDLSNTLDDSTTSKEVDTMKKKKNKKKKKALQNCNDDNNDLLFPFHHVRSSLLRINSISDKGRCLVTKQNINRGVIVFNESPYKTIGHNKQLCTTCNKILLSKNEIVIEDTSLPHDIFCSRTCYEILLNHQNYEYYQRMNQNISKVAIECKCDIDLLRMIFKLLILTVSSEHKANEESLFIDNGSIIISNMKALDKLENHLDRQSVIWLDCIRKGINTMINYLHPSKGNNNDNVVCLDNDYALHLACIINVNSYGIIHYNHSSSYSLGYGIFPIVGLLINHSCIPNCYYIYNSLTNSMEYRTIRDISCGEEITVSYIDLFQNNIFRRQYILDNRFFLCKCSRCIGYDYSLDTIHHICTQYNQVEVTEDYSSSRNDHIIMNKKKNNKKKINNHDSNHQQFISIFSKYSNEAYDILIDNNNTNEDIIKNNIKMNDIKTASKDTMNDLSKEYPVKNILSDSKLNGLYCSKCGKDGIILMNESSLSSDHNTNRNISSISDIDHLVSQIDTTCNIEDTTVVESKFAACLVCCQIVSYEEASNSKKYMENQWLLCNNTLSYTPTGSATILLIENVLKEIDPHYCLMKNNNYDPKLCDIDNKNNHTSNNSNNKTLQQLLQSRKNKNDIKNSKIQLHPNHQFILQAYIILSKHILLSTNNNVDSSNTVFNIMQAQFYIVNILNRIIYIMKSIFPYLHPEITIYQIEFIQLIKKDKEEKKYLFKFMLWMVAFVMLVYLFVLYFSLIQEFYAYSKALLEEVISARSVAYGTEHPLTIESTKLKITFNTLK